MQKFNADQYIYQLLESNDLFPIKNKKEKKKRKVKQLETNKLDGDKQLEKETETENKLVVLLFDTASCSYTSTVQQLKCFLKSYKLKTTGCKTVLQNRLYGYLILSPLLVKIQATVRGYICRTTINYHGPGVLKRNICNNVTDFNTLEDIKEIPLHQFFSYMDSDGFIYGYNISSFFHLIQYNIIHGRGIQNPYNRKNIEEAAFHSFFKLLKNIHDNAIMQ